MSQFDPTWLCLFCVVVAAVVTVPPIRSPIAQAVAKASLEAKLCRDLHAVAARPLRLRCEVGPDPLLKEEVAVWALG